MRRRFATLDVFTDRRFAGNPLAVVLEPQGLEGDAMQAIAREFSHPETVFVFAPADPGHRARLRIFTPARELPFAGHPTVGTAVLLALSDRASAGSDLVLEEGIGPVRCTLEAVSAGRGSARIALPQLSTQAGSAPDAAAVAAGLALSPGDIDGTPARWSAGNPLSFVPIRSLAAVARCRPDPVKFEAAFGRDRGRVRILQGDRRARAPFPRPHVRARPRLRRRSGDGICRCGFRRAHRAATRRRGARDRHRAGLRDGPAEPDARHRRRQRRPAQFGGDRRRRRRGDRGDARSVTASPPVASATTA